MININDIETADLSVKRMEINKTEISIDYDEVYFIPNKEYISNIKIVIKDWEEKEVKIYTCETPLGILLNEEETPPFWLIQEILHQDNDIILKGYSSSDYMEYYIKEGHCEVITQANQF